MSDAIICDLLRRVPLFADLPAADLEAVARMSRPLPRKKGARVFEEGSSADCCLVLTSGRAKVVLSGTGDSEIIIGMLEPFDIVGELALVDQSTRSAGLVAVDDCQFIRVPREAFQTLRKNLAFQDKLLSHITSTLRRANDQLRAIHTFKALDRVAWNLGRIARNRGRRQGPFILLQPKPHHQEIADMTGCSRETVTRAFKTLERRKIVMWDDDTMRIDAAAFKRHFRSELVFADVTEITRLV
jgi:CRP/FNR family cyclic AMP-dependent transcriptional regulator